jgi:hypothetical protein
MQKIEFQPMARGLESFLPAPIPSRNTIPNWYKNAPLYVNNEKDFGMHPNPVASVSNSTLKGCVPFLDAFTTGYMAVLSSDVEFKKVNGEITVRWLQPIIKIVEGHNIDQTFMLPTEHKEEKYASKWLFDWHIKTPPGYSCLYTHPLNRHDLPFRTFTGVVDTDTFPDSVHFPFQILNFEGERTIVPAGTPICQIFPFKRDSWESDILEFEEGKKQKAVFKILSFINRSYKRQFWHKKSYN